MDNLSLYDKIIKTDTKAINTVFKARGVGAKFPSRTMHLARKNSMIALASHCMYTIHKSPGEDVNRIVREADNISQQIALARKKAGLIPNNGIRIIKEPFLVIEVDSPVQKSLSGYPLTSYGKFVGAIGESYSYDGKNIEAINLNSDYQTLIASLSGHGKTQLLINFILSLCYSTSPQDVEIYIIDMKFDSLALLKDLPQVAAYCSDAEEAISIIQYINSIKEKRKAMPPDSDHKAIVLIIDELAEVQDNMNEASPDSAKFMLSSIMNLGRGLKLFTILCTQYPVAKIVGSGVAKAATSRIVGRVSDASASSFVSGITGLNAQNLKKVGSFYKVDIDGVKRFKSYYISEMEIKSSIEQVQKKWGSENEKLRIPKKKSRIDQAVENLENYNGNLKDLNKSELKDIAFGKGNWHSNTYYKELLEKVLDKLANKQNTNKHDSANESEE